MNDIRRKLFTQFPYTKILLLPTKFIDIRAVEEDEDITETVEDLRKKQNFAKKYDFCRRYCKQNNIHNMELSTEKGGESSS